LTGHQLNIFTGPLYFIYKIVTVINACKEYDGIYFGATGGAGALLGKKITSAEIIAYPELGPEAIRKITVVDFPVTVINDTFGNDLYQMGREQYEVK